MKALLLNILLALIWAIITELFTVANFVVGFLMGYVILLFTGRAFESRSYLEKVPQVLRFVVFYLWKLLLANLRVAFDVVTPTHYMRPAVIAIPLEAESDVEITLLSNLITLTPGSLCLDVSADRRTMYLHAMYVDADDVDAYRQQLKQSFETRVLELLR